MPVLVLPIHDVHGPAAGSVAAYRDETAHVAANHPVVEFKMQILFHLRTFTCKGS